MENSSSEQRIFGSESLHARLTLIYLGLPALVFLVGFIDSSMALPFLALLTSSLFFELRARPESGRSFSRPEWRWPAISGAMALVVLLLVGFPSGPFAWDWVKHWALVNVLSSTEWPTSIEVEGVPHFLRFYMGAYLVPAAVTRLLHLPTWMSFGLWLGFGYGLVIWMAARCAFARRPLAVLGASALFVGVAGADIWLLTLLRDLAGVQAMPMLGTHSEWWSYATLGLPVQYSSILAALVWVPHQSIATFLVAGSLLFRDEPEDFPTNLLAYGLLALWSPFGMIGLLPLLAIRAWPVRTAWLAPRIVVAGVAAGAFAALMAALLAGGLSGQVACFTCVPERIVTIGPKVLLFLAVELAFFAIVLRNRLFRDPVCIACLVVLGLLPFIGGDTPDLVMRVSLGPLCILALISVKTLFSDARPSKLVTAVALLLCLPTSLGEIVYQRTSGRAHFELATKAPQDPLSSRWYSTFAPTSEITMDQYVRLVPPTEWGQYFTTTLPGVYRSR